MKWLKSLMFGVVIGIVGASAIAILAQATYPSGVKSFTTKNNGDAIQASHVNDVQTEVTAIEGGILNGFAHVVKPLTDATYDLGTTLLKWRDLYVSRNATVGGTLDVTGVTTLANTGLHLLDTNASHDLIIAPGSNITADRTLTIVTGDASRTLTLSGDVTLSATPYAPSGTDVALADGGTGASLTDPNADRIPFWDDSAGAVTWLTAGTGLTITDTTIAAASTTSYALEFVGGTTSGGDWSPADSTTYYAGAFLAPPPSATAALARVYVPKAGTISAAYVSFRVQGTLATTESVTVSLRLNNTTDTQVTAAAQMQATWQTYSNTGLSISVAQGDYLELKIACPAFATNPTSVTVTGVIYIS